MNAPGDSIVTKFSVIGAPSPYVADGKWILHEWNTADSTFIPKPTNIASRDSLNAYIVDKGNYWTLWTKPGLNATKLDSLNLPKYLAVPTIEVLGFGYDVTTDYTYFNDEPNHSFSFNRISSPISGDWSAQRTLSSGASNLILANLVGETIIIRVSPDDGTIVNKEFVLHNNLGEEVPMKLGKPVKLTGLLRSDSEGALYNIPLDVEPAVMIVATYTDKMSGWLTLKAKNADSVQVRYSLFELEPYRFPGAGAPSVSGIGGYDNVNNSGGTLTANVSIGKLNRIEIKDAYDYYAEASAGDVTEFGIVIEKKNGTVKIGKKSSAKTSFPLTVHYLGLDGVKGSKVIEVTPVE